MDNVLVTGFGPFGNFPVNASWETAKELRNLEFESNGVNLITEEVEVVYETVQQRVPQLWEKHQPKLVIHIGVSAYAKELTLETCAHREGYTRPDIQGKIPAEAPSTTPVEIKTCFDLEEVTTQFNATNKDISTVLSVDAGRYLCEFIFYTSLCIQPERTVFIHVPDIGKPYSVPQMAAGIKELILLLIDQVRVKCPSPK